MPPSHWLPLARWNLRYNPFGELTPDERANVAIFDPQPIAQQLAQGQTAVQFLGRCGRGKTTRLLVLERHLAIPPESTIYLPPWSWTAPPWWLRSIRLAGAPLLIDEAQRLIPPVRRLLLRRRVPLILGTHRDLTKSLRRAGYRVVTHVLGPANNAPHVAAIANARLRAARLSPADVPQLSIIDAQRLVARFGDDLRSMETFLYHQVQQQVGNHDQMRFID